MRGEFIERVKAECNKAERTAREKHPNSSGEIVFKDEWIRELRTRTQEKAEKLVSQRKIGLTQVALAGWHLKYVDQKVCERDADPDPSFPWTLFRQELTALKEHYQPCPIAELRRNHTCFRRLQRGAAQEHEESVWQAVAGLKFNMKCKECSRDRKMLLDTLKSHGSFSEIAAAVKDVSGRGELIRVGIDDLRYCKDSISDVFDHGLNAGMKLNDLVQKLLINGTSNDLELTAVKFHGHLYVIEGNKRLWCLKEAQKGNKEKLEVSVRVPDLYLGFVQRQEHKEPVLPYFLQRFCPRSGGRDILLQHEQQHPSEQCDMPQVALRTCVPKVNEHADIQEVGSKILGCGKYKGCSYGEACQDKSYRNWVMQNIGDTSSPEMQELKRYMLRRSNAEPPHATSSQSSQRAGRHPGTWQQDSWMRKVQGPHLWRRLPGHGLPELGDAEHWRHKQSRNAGTEALHASSVECRAATCDIIPVQCSRGQRAGRHPGTWRQDS